MISTPSIFVFITFIIYILVSGIKIQVSRDLDSGFKIQVSGNLVSRFRAAELLVSGFRFQGGQDLKLGTGEAL